jgi:Ca2+/Na+ antiporter
MVVLIANTAPVGLQSIMLILMGVLTGAVCCVVGWAAWQMWRNAPRLKANSYRRAVVAVLGVFYLGVAAAALAFGRVGILVAVAVPLVIALALHVATLVKAPRSIRNSSERRRHGREHDPD